MCPAYAYGFLALLICGFALSYLRAIPPRGVVERFETLDHLTFEGTYKITFVRDLLDRAECDEVIRTATPFLARSEVMADNKHGKERTSYSCFLYKDAVDQAARLVLDKISDRAARFSGLPESHQEALQVARYMPGQLYEPHFDACEPLQSTICQNDLRDHGGRRHSTLLIYLNDVEEGGETEFPELDKMFRPSLGSAIFFTNLLPDSDMQHDPLSRHGARGVRRGIKWVCNQWIRTGPFK